MDAPSGQQYEIVHGEQRATIVEIGGGIREFRDGEVDVLQPYSLDAVCDGAHGTPLAPWPNRLGDGEFSFDGTSHRVPLTEPEKQNAIHGFLRWRSWTATDHRADAVTMAARIRPMPFWPFDLGVQVTYQLGAAGLSVTVVARNLGDIDAPWAYGQHPYLSPGDGTVDECTLTFAARTRISTDDRQLPTGKDAVDGTDYDFSRPRRIGGTEIDYAFTDLERDAEGRAWLILQRPDERTARVWVDDSFPYLEVYTADTLAPERKRRGLGVEPMTAPPNALQSGTDVVRIAPGGTSTHRWGARLEGPNPPA